MEREAGQRMAYIDWPLMSNLLAYIDWQRIYWPLKNCTFLFPELDFDVEFICFVQSHLCYSNKKSSVIALNIEDCLEHY